MQKSLGKQGQQGPKIDITKTVPIICDNAECENDMFMHFQYIRRKKM